MPRRNYCCKACGQSAYWSREGITDTIVCAPFACRTPVPLDDLRLLPPAVRLVFDLD